MAGTGSNVHPMDGRNKHKALVKNWQETRSVLEKNLSQSHAIHQQLNTVYTDKKHRTFAIMNQASYRLSYATTRPTVT